MEKKNNKWWRKMDIFLEYRDKVFIYSPMNKKWYYRYYNYLKNHFEYKYYTTPEECWKKTGGFSFEDFIT